MNRFTHRYRMLHSKDDEQGNGTDVRVVEVDGAASRQRTSSDEPVWGSPWAVRDLLDRKTYEAT